ncbi:MAG: hypothetical protein KJZ85_19515 [Rhodobacteraceae bacterium]|jgi:hypothetical protein|nr:hypothetical protein [Paracoccaceae bacterium]
MLCRRGAVLLLAAHAGLAQPAAADPFLITVGIARHAAKAYTPGQGRAIVEEMNRVLGSQKAKHDTSDCPVRFAFAGIKTLDLPAAINGEDSYRRVVRQNATPVVLVDKITACMVGNTLKTGVFAGCSFPDSAAAVTWTMTTQGNLAIATSALMWLHEFGHSQRLNHSTATKSFMRATISHEDSMVPEADCRSLGRTNRAFPAALPGTPVVVAGEPQAAPMASGIEGLLGALWMEDVPVADLLEVSDEVAVLREILSDPGRAGLWPNAVLALGVLGDAGDVGRLAEFHRALGAGERTPAAAETLFNLPLAMGMLGGRTGEPAAEAFLADVLDDAIAGVAAARQAGETTPDSVFAGNIGYFALLGRQALAGLTFFAGGDIVKSNDPAATAAQAEALGLGADVIAALEAYSFDVQRMGLPTLPRDGR